MKTTLEKQDLVKRLIERAFLSFSPNPNYKKPGSLIQKLNEKDREIVKELKAEDFNHRI